MLDDVLTLPELPDDHTGPLDVETVYESIRQCEGRYEVDPIPGGKRFQGSWLVLDDRTRYVLSYRPMPDFFPYVNKRVIITGRPYHPGSDTQYIQAAHFQVTDITLAEGESPYEEAPTQLPAPPLLHTTAELCAYAGRWVQVVGKLVALIEDPDAYFCIAHLQLAGGDVIIARNAAKSLWGSFIRRTVTVTSRVEVELSRSTPGISTAGIALVGWYALCPGEVTRCGMSVDDPYP